MLSPLRQSSYPYTVAGVLLDVTAATDLGEVEKLPPEEAFARYESLAGKDTEAAYLCGLMLLEGRGTRRNFLHAYSCLNGAKMQGHVKANEVFSKIEKKMNWLRKIVFLLNEASTYNDGTVKITPELQHGMKMLILSDKEEEEAENILITYHDITEAIDDVADYFQEDDSRKPALQRCMLEVANSFPLTEGYPMEATPLIMTRQQQLVLVEKIMSLKDKAGKKDTEKWTITRRDIPCFAFSNQERRFLIPVWLNAGQADAYRQNRMASLLEEGIESYNHREQARVGFMSEKHQLSEDIWIHLDQFLSMRAKLRLAITSRFQFDQNKKDLQSEAFWLAKLQSGLIIPRQVESSSWNSFVSLFKSKESEQRPPAAKTLFLEDPPGRKDCYLPLDKAGKEYLKNKGIEHPALLKLIENGRLSLANCPKLPELSEDGKETLHDPGVQEWLAESDNLLHLPHIIKASKLFAEAMRNQWVRDGITSGKLTVHPLTKLAWPEEQVILDPAVQRWLDEGNNSSYLVYIVDSSTRLAMRGAEAFRDPVVQKWLDEGNNSSYLFSAIRKVDSFGNLVRNQWVRDGITSNKLPVDLLTKIAWLEEKVFLDPAVQKWLDKNNNLSHLSHLITGPRSFRDAIQNQWIRDGIESGKLPVGKLDKLTCHAEEVLRDREVQKWLDEKDNFSSFFSIIIECSELFGKLVSNKWVRDSITSGKLIVEPLFTLTELRVEALLDSGVQKWLDENNNLSYLPYLIDNDSDRFARLVCNPQVRNGITNGTFFPRHF